MNQNLNEEEIKSKIKSIEKQINEDLLLIPEYQLLSVYNKLNKIIVKDEKKYIILRNKFMFLDKTLTGYINLKDFYNILRSNLPLEKDELKILLCDPALKSKINPNLYQNKPFFDSVRNFKKTELLKMEKEYNIEQNQYIINIKQEIINKKIDIKDMWEKCFNQNNILCTKDKFYLLFQEINFDYKYHKLEIEYIFDIICKIGEDNIKFEYFKDIMKKKYSEDIRIIYFKRIKELKRQEKEKVEEKEKLLINYYPNVLENNINMISESSNEEKNTKYVIIKGEETLNSLNNDIIENFNNNKLEQKGEINNNNEKFILGQTNQNTSNIQQISDNTQKEKVINSMAGTLDISESLAFKSTAKKDESHSLIKDELNKNKTSIIYKKYFNQIYDVQKDEDNEKYNTMIMNKKSLKLSLKDNKEKNIKDKIEESNNKVNELLNKHEEYLILKLYSSLKRQFNLLNEDLLLKFINKDNENKKYLSFENFISILQTEAKLNFVPEHLKLLLLSLQNIQNDLYSYEEFIGNVNNISKKNKEKIDAIKNLALMNFNTYIIDFKFFLINNNIKINDLFNSISHDKINISLNDFILLLKSLNYILENSIEYQFIFNIISKHAEKKILSIKDINNFINAEIISEEKFIEEGKISHNFRENIKKYWYKYIPKYDKKKINIDKIKNIESVFMVIHNQNIKYGINNLADLFALNYEVDINGNIHKNEFNNAMNLINIYNSKIINDLLIYFEESYDITKFQLLNFLGLYNLFFPYQIQHSTPIYHFKTFPNNPKINIKTQFGFFTSSDLIKIKELCLLINEKVCFIKRQNLNDYFNKFDFFQKSYFTIEQLKSILIDDLEIKKYELVNLFISYALDNSMENNDYVIFVIKLIEIINKFIENNDINKLKGSINFNYTNNIFNKLMNSTIMNIRLDKKENSTYYFSPNAGII